MEFLPLFALGCGFHTVEEFVGEGEKQGKTLFGPDNDTSVEVTVFLKLYDSLPKKDGKSFIESCIFLSPLQSAFFRNCVISVALVL